MGSSQPAKIGYEILGATLVDPGILMITVDLVVNLTDIRPFSGWGFGDEARDSVAHGIQYRAVPAEVVVEGLFAFRANV
jgi:hypothetical protein